VVYCSKCGAKNDDDAEHCTQCGAALAVSREKRLERRAEEWGEEFGRRAEAWGRQMEREFKGECFGLPEGGAIVGIILGVIILILGFAWLANLSGSPCRHHRGNLDPCERGVRRSPQKITIPPFSTSYTFTLRAIVEFSCGLGVKSSAVDYFIGRLIRMK